MAKKPEKVYLVETTGDGYRPNYDTGTRVYTRKGNALHRTGKDCTVVEYALVPTGNVWNAMGKQIQPEEQLELFNDGTNQ